MLNSKIFFLYPDTTHIEKDFALSTEQLKKLIQNLQSEMEKGFHFKHFPNFIGLSEAPADPSQRSCLKMIPGHIGKPRFEIRCIEFTDDLKVAKKKGNFTRLI